jgi:3-hydroxyisobutyrate dehydrogenase
MIAAGDKMDSTQVGVIGLGAMGSVMAPLLTDKSVEVLGLDPAVCASSSSHIRMVDDIAALSNCAAIILMLPDGKVVETVTLQLIDTGFAGLLIDMSSSHPVGTTKLGERLAQTGMRFIDAPVSGGVKKAAKGLLMIMAGGEADDIAAATGYLSKLGTVIHVGPLGAGHAMKALNNYVSAAGLAASMQALATAQQFGISPDNFVDVINGATGRNNTTEVKMRPFIIPRDYVSGFALKLMAKDVGIASDLMMRNGLDTAITPALNNLLADALATLGEEADHTALYEAIFPTPRWEK